VEDISDVLTVVVEAVTEVVAVVVEDFTEVVRGGGRQLQIW
jgi:hypothetical protein